MHTVHKITATYKLDRRPIIDGERLQMKNAFHAWQDGRIQIGPTGCLHFLRTEGRAIPIVIGIDQIRRPS